MLLTDSPVGMLIADAVRDADGQLIDFRYVAANDKIVGIVGLNHARQIEGQLMSKLFPQSFEPGSYFDRFQQALEHNQAVAFEEKHTNALGQTGWYRTTVSPHDDRVTIIAVDITDPKQAELDRRQQADRLERILDRVPAALFVSEAIYDEADSTRIVDFRIRDVNAQGMQPYGLSRHQIVGRRASELFPGDRQNGIFTRYVEVIQTQQAQSFEYDYVLNDQRRWIDVRLVPFDAKTVVATSLDITPIKQAQVSLEVMNEELRRSNENLQQFAYVASHDLQEPLRKVQSFGDLLRTSHAGELSAEALDLVQRMQSSAARMSVLIKDLLAYSRLTTQREAHQPHPLNDIITTALDDLDLRIRESGAQAQIGELPIVVGDAGQLRQLFQNLISNALKFQPAGQSPRVSITHRRVSAEHLPVATISRRNARHYWEICVEDNGIGFDEQYADRIFQVFQRLHGKNQFPGTGIGLAICQKVVQNHAGHIAVSSRPGEGATFRVYLPA